MSEPKQQITCVACGHVWSVSFAVLDSLYLEGYKAEEQPKRYSVPCPKCGTCNVLTVRVKEERDA